MFSYHKCLIIKLSREQGVISDSISFSGVVVLFVVAIIGSGYGKPFFRIFSSKKKFQSLNLQELRKTDQALEFAGKILFYTAVLIPFLVLIYTLRNFYKDAGTYRHLGPNMAVLLLSILYMALIEMILCTLKAKTHKAVIMYMADEKMLDRKKGAFSGNGIAVSQKHLYLNAVKLTVSLNWYAAFSGAACGWIGMLCNLEDISSLPESVPAAC
ncbi:MAG: hypothetical protein KBT02_04240 [Treponema sp.]|nr:hypothetical protein [Candidatus Treponema caballi]